MRNACGVPHRSDELEFAGCAACAWREYHKLINVLAAIDDYYEDLPHRVRQMLDETAKRFQAFHASRVGHPRTAPEQREGA